MADFASVSAVGKSLERVMNAAFLEEQPISGKTTVACLVRTEDFDPANSQTVIVRPALSIYLYRVDFNKTMRAAWSAVGSIDGKGHLPLDLHFLLTAWATNAEHEHLVLGRTLQVLETNPILSGALLHPAGWAPNDGVQLVLEEISTEALMRTFDSLPVDYKLSIPYIARVVRVDSKAARPSPPVLTQVSGVKPGVRP